VGTSVVENGGMMDPTYVLALLGFLDSNFEPLLLFSGDLSVFLERKFQLSRYAYLESGFRLETEILLRMNLGFIPLICAAKILSDLGGAVPGLGPGWHPMIV
jgi:hypothetical protein